MQSGDNQGATQEEKQLKRIGETKFKEAQQLTAGRDYLDAVSERDTSGRNAERLRSNQAVELSGLPIEDSAAPRYVDARIAANSGVAALAASEEDKANAANAVLSADLGISSSVSSSQRAIAQSAQQVQQAQARKKQMEQARAAEIGGAVLGGVASNYNFQNVDPLANPNQIAPDLSTAVDSQILPNPYLIA